MKGRNPAPWILVLTLVAGGVAFAVVDSANPDDVSGRKAGTALMIVVAAGILVMVIAQTVWTTRSRRRAELEALRAVTGATTAPADPGALSAEAMLMALAVRPVSAEEALESRSGGWDIAQASQRSAALMTVMVIALMTPAVLLQNARLMVVGAIPIVLYAIFLAARVVRPGGTLDRAHEASDRLLAPLGLATVARPELRIEPRPGGDGMQPHVRGRTVLGGTRHGRRVEVALESGRARTTVATASAPFELKGHRQRLRAEGDVPAPVQQLIASLKASTVWTSVEVTAGAEGIVIRRKTKGTGQPWLHDLWLAERLADLQASAA